jgi:AcrR family transcriptional regulator
MQTSHTKSQADSKAAIVQATLELAEEHGWRAVSIRKIAAKVNYSTIVVYDKFGSKKNLLLDVQQYGFHKLVALYASRLQGDLTPREKILVLSNCTWEFAEQNPELYKLMFGLSGVLDFPDPQNAASSAAQFVQQRLAPLFRDDVKSVFANWWALVHGFITIRFTGGAYPDMLKIYFDDAVRRFVSTAS